MYRLFRPLVRSIQVYGGQLRRVHGAGTDENMERLLARLAEIAERSSLQSQQSIDPWLLFRSVGIPIMAIFTGGLSGGFYLVSESIRLENELYRVHFDQKIDYLDKKIDAVESRIDHRIIDLESRVDQRVYDLRKDNQANFDRLYNLCQGQQMASRPKSWFSW